MKKNFESIACLYENAEKIRTIAAKMGKAIEEMENETPQKEKLSYIRGVLADIACKQQSVLRRKFFVKFHPKAKELGALQESYPNGAPQGKDCVQVISVPELCHWLDANPDMLGEQRNEFAMLDYSVFEDMYATLKQLKLQKQYLEEESGEMFSSWAYLVYETIRETERHLNARFATNFPNTLEEARRNPHFTIARFYKLLEENPQLLADNTGMFANYIRSMEMRNCPVPAELLEIYKGAILS